MASRKKRVSEFRLVGQLLDFVVKDGYKIKYLRLVASQQEYWIKLPKEIRQTLSPEIIPGCWLEVSGRSKFSKKTGKLKLKAEFVQLMTTPNPSEIAVGVAQGVEKKKTPSILVCQKSDCVKRGGKGICRAIEEYLRDRGLQESVRVKATGCLKQCKRGPNLVMMPDKARYSQISPQQIPELMEKHIASPDNLALRR